MLAASRTVVLPEPFRPMKMLIELRSSSVSSPMPRKPFMVKLCNMWDLPALTRPTQTQPSSPDAPPASLDVLRSIQIDVAEGAILVGIGFIVNGIGLTALGWGLHGARLQATR